MNDFNSRYRNLDDQPSTIRTNAGGYGYGGFGGDMDIMQAENAQKKKQVSRASQARGGSSSRGRKAKRQMLIYGIIIAVEVILLAVIWINYISFAKKAKGGSDSSAKTESGSEESGGNINVDNDNFTLICNKLTITTDASGNPVAVVGFTFTNKTDNGLSMNDVFAPSFKQNGADLMVGAMLAEQPAEIANAATQVSGGQSIDCAFAVSLQDNVSDITITMRDNYETYSDIGSVVVPIAQ